MPIFAAPDAIFTNAGAGAITKGQGVVIASGRERAQLPSGADQAIQGIAMSDGAASGGFSVILYGTSEVRIAANQTIAAGDRLANDASGNFVRATSETNKPYEALQAVTTTGSPALCWARRVG